VSPYPPHEQPPPYGQPYGEQPYAGQPPYGPAQPAPQFYAPPPYMPPPQPPRRHMSTGNLLLVILGSMLLLCVGGAVISTLVNGTDAAEPSATSTRGAGPVGAGTTATSVAPTMATVPNLVGKNAAVAGDELTKLGFIRVEYGSVDQLDTMVILPENWKVAEQSHVAGQTIPTDTLIVLGCTKQR
jgi:PASTA domain